MLWLNSVCQLLHPLSDCSQVVRSQPHPIYLFSPVNSLRVLGRGVHCRGGRTYVERLGAQKLLTDLPGWEGDLQAVGPNFDSPMRGQQADSWPSSPFWLTGRPEPARNTWNPHQQGCPRLSPVSLRGPGRNPCYPPTAASLGKGFSCGLPIAGDGAGPRRS